MITINEHMSKRDIIKASLEEIQEANGGLVKPENVVDAAEAEDSPLHNEFEWDDTEAGKQFRLHQARQLIRTYTIEVVEDNQPPKKVRGYVSLLKDRQKKGGGGYRSTRDVLDSEDLREELLTTFKHELDAFLSRFEVLGSIVKEVRKVAKIDNKRKKK